MNKYIYCIYEYLIELFFRLFQQAKFSESTLGSFDLSNCKIDENLLCGVDNSDRLVQIRVNDCELNRRVECFLKRKRDEINLYNINDFKKHSSTNESEEVPEESCARTQSFPVKQQQSNGHLKGMHILFV